jgi:hypothetical protein
MLEQRYDAGMERLVELEERKAGMWWSVYPTPKLWRSQPRRALTHYFEQDLPSNATVIKQGVLSLVLMLRRHFLTYLLNLNNSFIWYSNMI